MIKMADNTYIKQSLRLFVILTVEWDLNVGVCAHSCRRKRKTEKDEVG